MQNCYYYTNELSSFGALLWQPQYLIGDWVLAHALFAALNCLVMSMSKFELLPRYDYPAADDEFENSRIDKLRTFSSTLCSKSLFVKTPSLVASSTANCA